MCDVVRGCYALYNVFKISHVVWSVAVQLWEARARLACGATSLRRDKNYHILIFASNCTKERDKK